MKGNSKKEPKAPLKAPRKKQARARRKPAGEALRQSESVFRALFESALDGALIVDSELKVVAASEAAARMYGLGSGMDAIGLSILDFVAPEEKERVARVITEDLLEKDLRHVEEYRTLAGDGREIWISATGTRIEYEGKLAGLISLKDITEHKQAEESLRRSEDKFATAFRACPDPVCITTLKEGRYVDVNDSFLRATGYQREKVIGHTTPELGVFARQEDRDRVIRMVQTEGRISDLEFDFHTRSGQIRTGLVSVELIDLRGEPCLLTIANDITERRRAEEALKLQKAYFQQLFDNSPEGIAWLNDADRIVNVNAGFETLFGYRAEEIRGRLINDVVVPEDRLEEASALSWASQHRDVILQKDTVRKRKDGSLVDVSALGCPIRFGDDTVGVYVIYRDITERKRSEKELRKSEERYRSLFDSHVDPVTVYDIDGRLLLINAVGARNFGGRPEDFVGKSYHELFPEQGAAYQERHRQVALSGTPAEFEDMVEFPSGKRWFLSVLHPIKDERGNTYAVQIISHHITERKRAEEALQQREQYFRSLLENARDAVLVVNDDVTISYQSPPYTRTLGYVPEEELGGSLLDKIHPDDVTKLSDDLARLLQNPSHASHFEVRIRTRDGSWHIIEGVARNLLHDSAVHGIVVNFGDITERKRTEEALKQSEEKYRLLAENVTDLIYVMDTDMKVTYLNPAITRLLGFSVEEGMTRSLADSMTPASLGIAARALQSVLNAGKLPPGDFQDHGRTELEMYRKDGSIMWAESVVSVMRDSDGRPTGILGVTRDISQRKQVEEALRESEAKYAAVAEQAADGIVIVQDGLIKFANKAHAQITGYSVAELTGMPFLDTIDPSDRDLVARRYDRRMAGTPVSAILETRMLCKDGTVKEAEARATTIQYQGRPAALAVIRDVTERRRAEQELQHKEEFYRSLIENASDAMAILNTDGTIRYQSPSYLNVLGYLPEEEAGRNLSDHIHPDDIAWALEDLARLLQDPSYVSRFELRVRFRDGSWHTIEGTSRNLLHHPAVEGIVVNFHDITERKRAEEELQQAYERETQLRSELVEEMQKRVELTRALVHELKTPLTSVIASSELMALELPEGPLSRMAKNIHRSAGNLNNRIDELLDVARGELGMLRLNLMSVDPARVLKGLVEDMDPIALSQHQTLLLDLPPSLPPIWADESRLCQVGLNLLSNACKFTPQRGTITLRAKVEGDRLMVEVEDTGRGISEADQQWLFTPYYRGEADKERFSGLGLGLALSKMLVELHGGQMWVKSQQGKGSTFGFSLPLATESQQEQVFQGDEEE